ncbi:MAG: hypothetical protein H7Y38_11410 [Armatimonadetes bacterium]|nr:hypothetical protein [Armatimonadota bacterium]
MQQTKNVRGTLCAFVALLLIAVTGCNQSGEGAADATISGSPAPVASPMDARIQALANEQTKGREADAKKQAEAMKKLNLK